MAYADAVNFTETPDCLLYEDKTNLTFPFTGSVNYNCTFTLASRVTNVTAPISYIDSSFFYFKAITAASGELHIAPRAFPVSRKACIQPTHPYPARFSGCYAKATQNLTVVYEPAVNVTGGTITQGCATSQGAASFRVSCSCPCAQCLWQCIDHCGV